MKMRLVQLLMLSSVHLCVAQEKLLLDEAINTALKNHWSISISGNRLKSAEQNVRLSHLSFLPDMTLNAGRISSVNNTQQEFASGLTQQKQEARSSAWNADLAADLTLFDGFRMFEAKKLLHYSKENAEIGNIQSRESLIFNVSSIYYSIVRRKLELRELQRSTKYSTQRITIAETKFEAGSAAKPELLQTRMDLNTRKSETLKKEQELLSLKANLNLILGRSPETPFDVIDSIELKPALSFDQYINSVGNNSELIQKGIKKKETTSQFKITRSEIYPKLNATAVYGFDLNQNQAGFLLFNKTTGLTTGLGFSWNIFSGGGNKILMNIASYEILNADLEIKEADSRIRSELYSFYNYLTASNEIVRIETENYKMAEENLMIATERYKLGLSALLELTEAQRLLDIAASRLISALYETQIAELRLRLHAGMIR